MVTSSWGGGQGKREVGNLGVAEGGEEGEKLGEREEGEKKKILRAWSARCSKKGGGRQGAGRGGKG